MHRLISSILLLSFIFLTAPALALEVSAARFGVHTDKTRMVLELSEAADFRVFVLPDPYRLVVDLPAFDWRVGNIEKPKGNYIREVRSGVLQPGISRLVVDVDKPISVNTAFLLPAGGGQKPRLVVDFTPVSASVAAARQSNMFGRLSSGPDFNLTPVTRPAPNVNVPPTPPQKPMAGVAGKKPVVVIDPGHGGQDPGAVGGNRAYEKNVTLATSRELKKQLEATGRYTVYLTRDSDKFIKLADRVKIARAKGADLFISVHADSIDKPNVRGASVYTLSNTASDKQTEKLAARENKADLIGGVDLSHEDKDVANILIDLAMRDTMNQSKFFANALVGKLKGSGIRVLESPHRYAGFAVLKAADIPSILVEIGFMSNRAEASALATPDYQRKVAAALRAGVDAYFDKVQKNNKN